MGSGENIMKFLYSKLFFGIFTEFSPFLKNAKCLKKMPELSIIFLPRIVARLLEIVSKIKWVYKNPPNTNLT